MTTSRPVGRREECWARLLKVAAAEPNLTVKQLAKRFGFHTTTVAERMRAAGIARPRLRESIEVAP